MLSGNDMQSISVGLTSPNRAGRAAWRLWSIMPPVSRRLVRDHGRGARLFLLVGLAAALLAACQPEAETVPPQVRPVRTVTVVKRDIGETVSYTGRVEAENEARLAFRIAG